ncbi:MAG TPA: DUF2125 domain-containing protein [Paracoccaceae bacterium]|nr:DUF2125 domain-containing protein [Paracoccaceae bacterium]
MSRIILWAVAGLAVLAAAWTGGWYWLRGDVAAGLDAEEKRIAEAGGAISYGGREIGGFPFGYEVSYRDVQTAFPGGIKLIAPEMRGRATALEPGALTLDLPPQMQLTLPMGPDLPPVTLDLEAQGGQIVTRAGGDGALSHRLTAAALALAQASDGPFKRFEFQATAPALDLASTAGQTRYTGAFKADLASIAYAVDLPDMGEAQSSTSFVAPEAAFAFDAAGPAGIAPYLSGERDLSLTLKAESMATEGLTPMPFGPMKTRAEGADVVVEMALQDGIASAVSVYQTLVYDLDLSAANQSLPPVKLKAGLVEARMAMPLAMREELADFSTRIVAEGLEVNEEVWAMIDPGKVLPRDGAHLAIDLSGKARWTVEPASLLETPPEPGAQPFELPELKVNMLALRAAGAEIAAEGAAEMIAAGDGSPMPRGRLDVRAKGLQALLAKLAEIGLVQPDQTAMVNGLAAAYARPGEEPDSLVTEIVVGPQGVIVNGLPVGGPGPAPAAPPGPLMETPLAPPLPPAVPGAPTLPADPAAPAPAAPAQ